MNPKHTFRVMPYIFSKLCKMLSTNVLCIKKRKKRTYSISTRTENAVAAEKCNKRPGRASIMLHITEDTPPDMLAGAMDLIVHLPTGKSTKMSVERSTPMMDLLVQITTNNHLQLSNHTLEALAMAPSSERCDRILPFKPNTPIGALDTQHIRVIPKTRGISKNIPSGHQPFESTFRLKVFLPRNQLYVTRVNQSVHLSDIMKKVCEEKNLDPLKYQFRHPGNLDEILDPKLTLSDYQITEIYIVHKSTLNQTFSSNDIMALRKEEERKQMHTKTGGGVFNLIFRKGKSSTGSLSSENRSISPVHSDDSRSITPPNPPETIVERPKPPQRKRRPAPKPPQDKQQDSESKPNHNGLTICHSRNSSDSSGYHEASVLSDNCNTSLPRRPKTTVLEEQKLDKLHSQSTSNLCKDSCHSKSTSSLAIPSRKKKSAPPPPPVLKPDCVKNSENPSPVVASQPIVVLADPVVQETKRNSLQNCQTNEKIVKVKISEISMKMENQPENIKTETRVIENKEKNSKNELQEIVNSNRLEIPETENKEANTRNDESQKIINHKIPSEVITVNDCPEVIENDLAKMEIENFQTEPPENDLETDWQYQLPSPPKAFRDFSPVMLTNNVNNTDSVLVASDLIDKLKLVKEQSEKDLNSISSEEDILNKLSLEKLEKRKSLVYNRELATSLKMSDQVKNESAIAEMKKSSPKEAKSCNSITKNVLPNFQITTYNNHKQKLNIFEDDTIRSNTDLNKRNSFVEQKTEPLKKISFGQSMKNDSFKKNEEAPKSNYHRSSYLFSKNICNVLRSESFSNDRPPLKPVTRSKSQVVLNKYKEKQKTNNEENLSKSNSLFDVSGLQSLEVIKLIQNKLNTPCSSVENLDEPDTKSNVPSIFMGTWTERPKIPVNLKEDPDYKHSKEYFSKIGKSKEASFAESTKDHSKRIFKDSDSISQNCGNIVIKIRSDHRKPFGDINQINQKQRPYSVSFGSDCNTSTIPVVRSVEFKKPFKDFQYTSITQINSQTKKEPNGIYLSAKKKEVKPLFRVNSYSTPVVRGFNNLVQPNSFSNSVSNSSKGIQINSGDSKRQLLQDIRDFGGKKGLKAIKT